MRNRGGETRHDETTEHVKANNAKGVLDTAALCWTIFGLPAWCCLDTLNLGYYRSSPDARRLCEDLRLRLSHLVT